MQAAGRSGQVLLADPLLRPGIGSGEPLCQRGRREHGERRPLRPLDGLADREVGQGVAHSRRLLYRILDLVHAASGVLGEPLAVDGVDVPALDLDDRQSDRRPRHEEVRLASDPVPVSTRVCANTTASSGRPWSASQTAFSAWKPGSL